MFSLRLIHCFLTDPAFFMVRPYVKGLAADERLPKLRVFYRKLQRYVLRCVYGETAVPQQSRVPNTIR